LTRPPQRVVRCARPSTMCGLFRSPSRSAGTGRAPDHSGRVFNAFSEYRRAVMRSRPAWHEGMGTTRGHGRFMLTTGRFPPGRHRRRCTSATPFSIYNTSSPAIAYLLRTRATSFRRRGRFPSDLTGGGRSWAGQVRAPWLLPTDSPDGTIPFRRADVHEPPASSDFEATFRAFAALTTCLR